MQSCYKYVLLLLLLVVLLAAPTEQLHAQFVPGGSSSIETTISPGVWAQVPAGFVDMERNVGALQLLSSPWGLLLRNGDGGGDEYTVLPIRLRNNGTGNLVIDPRVSRADETSLFVVNPSKSPSGSLVIAPGETVTLRLGILGTSEGWPTSVIVLRTNDPLQPRIQLPIVRIDRSSFSGQQDRTPAETSSSAQELK